MAKVLDMSGGGTVLDMGDDPRIRLDINRDMSRGDALWFAGMMGVGDTARGIGQITGKWKTEKEQRKLHELMDHPEYGTEVKAAYFGGLFLDPAGWALPAAKARNVWKMFKYGLGTGAVAGGLGYVDPEAQSLIGEGKLGRPEQAALGMVAGGVLAPAIGRGIPKLAEATGLKKLAKGYEKNIGGKAWNSIVRTPEYGTTPLGALYGYNYDEDASMQDKMRNALLGSLVGGTAITKLTPSGRAARQWVGRKVVPMYGMTEGYVHKRGVNIKDENTILMEFNDILKKVQKLDEPTRYALYKVAVGEGTPDEVMKVDTNPALANISKEARDTVKKYGKEMVDLGILSKDTYLKNINTYLHRVYQDPEAVIRGNKNAGLSPISNDDKIKFSFNELKMRGNVEKIYERNWNVDRELYTAKNPDGTYTYDIVKAEGIETGDVPLYLHKDKDYYYKKLFNGEIKPESVIVRKDWTPEERLQMGEVQDIAVSLERTGRLMANDIAAARFYKSVADDFSLPENTDPRLLKERGYTAFISKERIGDTGRYRYGALQGRMVDPNVKWDIEVIEKYRTGDDWTRVLDGYKRLNRVWKSTKTVLNLPVHFNNTVSNMQVYDGLGGKSAYFDEAVKDLWSLHIKGNETEGYRLAKQYGVFGGGFVENELGDSSKKILRSFADATRARREKIGGASKAIDRSIDDLLPYIPKYVEKLGRATKKYSYDALSKLYQSEDYVYRLGLFKTLVAEGMENYAKKGINIRIGDDLYEKLVVGAATTARKGFVDYSVKTPLLQTLRHTLLPFVAYMYGIIPRLGEIAVKRPWKMAKWALLWHGLNSFGEQFGDPEAIAEERRTMPPEQRGTVHGLPFYIPKEIRVPFMKGPEGETAYWGISRAKPGGEIFEPATERGYQLPFVPQWAQPLKQGGAAGALGRAALGVPDFGTGQLTGREKWEAAGKAFIPNVPISGFPSYAGKKLERGFYPGGFISETKDAQTKASAILQSIGPKVHFIDPRKTSMRQEYKYRALIEADQKKLRGLQRTMQEKIDSGVIITEKDMKEFSKEEEKLLKKIEKLVDKFSTRY